MRPVHGRDFAKVIIPHDDCEYRNLHVTLELQSGLCRESTPFVLHACCFLKVSSADEDETRFYVPSVVFQVVHFEI